MIWLTKKSDKDCCYYTWSSIITQNTDFLWHLLILVCFHSVCTSVCLFIYFLFIGRCDDAAGYLYWARVTLWLIKFSFLSFVRSFVFPKSSFSHFSVLTATSIDRSIKLENLRAYNVCPIKDSLEKHPHKNSRENSFIWEKGRTYVTITKTLHIRKANVEAK